LECSCKMNCSLYSVIVSALFAVAFALFSYFDFLNAAETGTFMLIAGLILVPVTLFTAMLSGGQCCVCSAVKRISLFSALSVAGAVVTIFARTVLGATLSAIVIGGTAFCLAFALGTIICAALCMCGEE